MQINGEILKKFFLLFDKKISKDEKKLLLLSSGATAKNPGFNKSIKDSSLDNSCINSSFHSEGQSKKLLTLNKNSQKFLEKFFKYKKIFSFCPFVKGIFIGNTVAFGSAKKSSDIDLFIVFENGKIWTGRLFLTILIHFFGVRRHGKKISGRFCLSFFASEKGAFELENIQIEKNSDIYLAIWTATLIPVFGEKKFFEEFFEKNKWVENFGIKAVSSSGAIAKDPDSSNSIKNLSLENPHLDSSFHSEGRNIKTKKFLEKLLNFNFIEKFLRKILKPRAKNKKNKIENNYGIIISDDYLKFHDNDKRREIMKKFI